MALLTLVLVSKCKLIYNPEPTTIRLTSGNFSGDISITQMGRGECDISTAQCRGLDARIKLRAIGQKPDKEFSNLR